MNVHAWIQKHHWVPIMVSATHNRYHYPFVNELITAYSTNILNLLGTGMQAVMRLPISSLFQQLNISTNVLWNSFINANDSVFSPICCSLNREQNSLLFMSPVKTFPYLKAGATCSAFHRHSHSPFRINGSLFVLKRLPDK